MSRPYILHNWYILIKIGTWHLPVTQQSLAWIEAKLNKNIKKIFLKVSMAFSMIRMEQNIFRVGLFKRNWICSKYRKSLHNAVFNKFGLKIILEPSWSKKRQKSPNQETGLGNKWRLKVHKNAKLILND